MAFSDNSKQNLEKKNSEKLTTKMYNYNTKTLNIMNNAYV